MNEEWAIDDIPNVLASLWIDDYSPLLFRERLLKVALRSHPHRQFLKSKKIHFLITLHFNVVVFVLFWQFWKLDDLKGDYQACARKKKRMEPIPNTRVVSFHPDINSASCFIGRDKNVRTISNWIYCKENKLLNWFLVHVLKCPLKCRQTIKRLALGAAWYEIQQIISPSKTG